MSPASPPATPAQDYARRELYLFALYRVLEAGLLALLVFGPVAAIIGFDGEQAGIDAANDTEYGLAAYVYTQGLDRALRVAEAIEAGMVGVNRGVISDVAAPFGGIKESGIGREAGSEGIEEYLETKYIALQ